MFNQCMMIGNLTKDIELRYLPNGNAVANSAIATNRKYKKQDGTEGSEVCFVNITFFGKLAEIVNQYSKKGSKLMISGRLKFDQWSDTNGNKRSKHSIIVDTMEMLDCRKEVLPDTTKSKKETPAEIDIDEDEIPF